MVRTKVGRPRSEKSREAILNAAHHLLTEHGGGGLTIEAIARQAGVGKPTIYRWWPSLADIVLEASLDKADEDIPVPECGTFRETLLLFLDQSMAVIEEWGGPHLRFLMAQAQMDEDFRRRFRDGFVTRRRGVLLSILRRASDQGQLRPGHNPEIVVDIVFGAMWYRLLTGHGPLDQTFARDLAGAVAGLVEAEG